MRSLSTRTSDDPRARRRPPLHLETRRMALPLDSVRLIRDRCSVRGPILGMSGQCGVQSTYSTYVPDVRAAGLSTPPIMMCIQSEVRDARRSKAAGR